MYVIGLHADLDNRATQLLTERHHAPLHLTTNRSLQHPKSVLRNPHQVILTMPDNLRSSLKLAHARSFLSVVGTTLRKLPALAGRSNRHSQLGDDRVRLAGRGNEESRVILGLASWFALVSGDYSVASESTFFGDWKRTALHFRGGEMQTKDRFLELSRWPTPMFPGFYGQGWRLGARDYCAALWWDHARKATLADIVCHVTTTSASNLEIRAQYQEFGRQCEVVARLRWASEDSRSALVGPIEVRCESSSGPNPVTWIVRATVSYEKD